MNPNYNYDQLQSYNPCAQVKNLGLTVQKLCLPDLELYTRHIKGFGVKRTSV